MGKVIADNPTFSGDLFPAGYAWTNSSVNVVGLVNDPLNKPYFSGSLNGTAYAGPYFTYSPIANAACNTTLNFDYVNSFVTALGNSSLAECALPHVYLIDHLVTFLGTMEHCSEFNGTTLYNATYIQEYTAEGKFVGNTDYRV